MTAPFIFSGSFHAILMVVAVTSNTLKFNGLLGTVEKKEKK